MVEVWRDIPGFEGLYQINNHGLVKSCDRNMKTKGYKVFHLRKTEGNILKSSTNKHGYQQLVLSKNGKTNNYTVHRLMMETFVPNPENLPCVNHKDGNRNNNYIHINPDGTVNPELSNLEWCDYQYNNTYGGRMEVVSKKLTNHPKISKPVLQYTMTGELVDEYPSTMEIERKYGYLNTHISECCLGKVKTAYGYVWKYKNPS